MRLQARIVLLPLDRKELNFCKAILKSDFGNDLPRLMTEALRIALQSARGLDEPWTKEIKFYWKKLNSRPPHNVRGYWNVARDTIIELIEQNRKTGVLVGGLPMIGVPTRIASAAVFHPEELMRWLAFRAIANKQLGRFVKCDYCGAWGLRERARKSNRYCKTECQEAAHLELVKRSQNEAPAFAALGQSGRDAIRTQQIKSTGAKKGKLPAMLENEKKVLELRSRRSQLRKL